MRVICAAAIAAIGLTTAAWAGEATEGRAAVDADQLQRTMESIHAEALTEAGQVRVDAETPAAPASDSRLAGAEPAPEDDASARRS